jgi:hypothetical protein
MNLFFNEMIPIQVPIQDDERETIWLLNPRQDDPRFYDKEHTVFLRPGYSVRGRPGHESVEGCSYGYSDTLSNTKSREEEKIAQETARKKFSNTHSALFIQEYLRVLLKKPNLLLVHIRSGVNRINGYPYRLYGYIADP